MGSLPSPVRALVRTALAACAAWLAAHELRVVLAGGASLGPFRSRDAHDIVLLIAAAVCLVRGALIRRERTAWLLLGAGVLA